MYKNEEMKILVIIPAYNEEKNIKETVERLKESAASVDYVVINDCSKDRTERILKNLGITYISLPVNLGIGGAVQTGYKYGVENGYIESGQADDYKAQMEERFSLLRNPELKNVELPAMNSDQGPLMHMEVMEDPKEWTNTVVKQFFGKESVIEVPRSER